jgi:hypothetical protein
MGARHQDLLTDGRQSQCDFDFDYRIVVVVVVVVGSGESSFETAACQDMSLGAEELN